MSIAKNVGAGGHSPPARPPAPICGEHIGAANGGAWFGGPGDVMVKGFDVTSPRISGCTLEVVMWKGAC